MFEGLLQPTHLILILVIVLIVFGPGKIPDVGKALGSAVRSFRDASNQAMETEMEALRIQHEKEKAAKESNSTQAE